MFSNFEIPRLENRIADGDEEARSALLALLHPELQFRRANATFAGRTAFEPSNAPRAKPTLSRERSSAFAVLDLKAVGALVSIDVHTVDTASPPPGRQRFRNLRGFALEGDRWLCRVWMNYLY